MAILFPLVLGLLVTGLSLGVAANKKQKVVAAWSAAADELGLSYSSSSGMGYGSIYGTVRGVTVGVDESTRGSGDSRKHYTRCHLQFPITTTHPFKLSKQKPFSAIAKLFGQSDISIGDPSFDSRVVIEALDPVAVDRYLTPARRIAVTLLMESNAYVEIRAGSLTTETYDLEDDPSRLAARIRHLVDVAFVLGAPSDVDVALEKQQRGDLADAVVALHELNDVQDGDANSFTQLLEAEALVAMGDGEKASTILEELPVFDPQLGEWKTVAKNHPKPVELKPISSANVSAPVLTPEVDVSLDQQSVIDDLFDSNRAGYEVEKRFFDVYESTIVTWEGTVRRTQEFRSDRDFPGAGVKATIEIGSRGNSKLMSNKIHAIVHFPEGTALRNDEEIRFKGSFVRTDRYMRNLFIANAEAL